MLRLAAFFIGGRMMPHIRSVLNVFILVCFLPAGKLFAQNTAVPLQLVYTGSWGGTGSGEGELKEPQSLAVDPAGNVFICDTGNHRMQKFSLQGRLIAHAGGFGWGQEQFDLPVSITARNGLDVYIADFNTNRILRYDKDCHYISAFSPGETDDPGFRVEYPVAVDINPLGELYILDSVNRKAVKYDRTGNPVTLFGDIGGGEGRLQQPAALHVDATGNVIIADRGERCLKLYDMYGNFLYDIGRDTNMDPGSITTLGSDFIICADAMTGTIRLFLYSGASAGVLRTGIDHLSISDIDRYQRYLLVLDTAADMVFVFTITAVGE